MSIGNLVEPTTREQFYKKSVRLPPKLFSHNDQHAFAQASQPEGASDGWGGRIGDLLQSANGTAALTCMTINGDALFLSGQNVAPYTIGPGHVQELLFGYKRSDYYNLRQLMTADTNCFFGQEYAKTSKRMFDIGETLPMALASAGEEQFPGFAKDNGLANQLKMVARLISIAPSLGLKRQVFFVGMGGWDMHSNLSGVHPAMLAKLSDALACFYNTTVRLGVENQVTSFTASEFGRSLGENGDGSDHGWGGVQFVMGGAVNGGRIFGAPSAVGLNTVDDVHSGRLIPTTSMDQLAATMALWFGVPPNDLPFVMPNLRYFDQTKWDLGLLN